MNNSRKKLDGGNHMKTNDERDMIAIIGIGCRFAGGVTSPAGFWELLKNGVDAIQEVPGDRWGMHHFDKNRSKPGKTYARWGGFLDRVDQFDASFFGISPREASILDPQQRLLLETSYEAIEDAGLVAEKLSGSKTGVFIGGFTLDYMNLQFDSQNKQNIDSHTATGVTMTLLANRLSYVFNFNGPSVALDTACSSSLVAVHLACQSLWSGESTLALAGGVNVMLTPSIVIAESKAGMLSPTGRSKTFDASADGYVRGEGAGVVILKPYQEALADGDPIYALIRATACNQDGSSPGITVPRGEIQQSLLKEVYAKAGIEPHEIQYVEAHGTGTPVGDPIEANAIGAVVSLGRSGDDPCYIGSVKTNIGHTEAAAGVAGLIKAALSLKYGEIPAHLHLKNPNPHIEFDRLKLRVPLTHTQWPKTNGPRLAGVNSFGFGGTNAHVVLQGAPIVEDTPIPTVREDQLFESENMERACLVPFSASNERALGEFVHHYQNHLAEASDSTIVDIGYTMGRHRSHYMHRLAIVATSRTHLLEQMSAFENISSRLMAGQKQSHDQSSGIVFVFTGMGPQWWAMGRQLYQEEPLFRALAEEIDGKFIACAGWSLVAEMMANEAESRMEETAIAQPANFLLQVGLAALWRSWGICPTAIVGHSAGEVAAAYEAGAMSLEDAVRVIYHRSRLQQKTTGQGRLVAIGLPLHEVLPILETYSDRVSLAAINSPNSVALAGETAVLEEIEAYYKELGIFCRFVHGNVPYHSHFMEPQKEELLHVLQDIKLENERIPLYSTVAGKKIKGTELDNEYWWRNVRDSVHFAGAMEQLIEEGNSVFLEIGPHPVLGTSINECLMHADKQGFTFSSLRRKEGERAHMLSSLGMLYALGFTVDWETLYPQGRRIKFSSYPWQRESYWHETERSRKSRLGEASHPLLGHSLQAAHPIWESEIDVKQLPYLDDHRIQNTIVYPGVAYAEMMMAACQAEFGRGNQGFEVTDLEFRKALFLYEEESTKLQVHLSRTDGRCGVYRESGEQEWTLHAACKVRPLYQFPSNVPKLADLQRRCTQEIDKERCYRQFRNLGLEYGATFQGIKQLWQGDGQGLALVEIPEQLDPGFDQYIMHPAVLDVCFQVLASAMPFSDGEKSVYMPVAAKRGLVRGRMTRNLWIHAQIEEQTEDTLRGGIRMYDSEGALLIDIQGCEARSLRDEAKGSAGAVGYAELSWLKQDRIEAGIKQEASGKWVIFKDKTGVAGKLAKQLAARGDQVICVERGETFAARDGHVQFDPADQESYRKLMEIAGNEGMCKGIVHLWGLDAEFGESSTLSDLAKAEEIGTISVFMLVKALAHAEWQKSPKLWLVTRGAQQVLETPELLQLTQSPLWGLARAIGHQEHMDLWGGIIDLDAAGEGGSAPWLDEAAALADEMTASTSEDQIAYRQGQRYVLRIVDSGDVALPLPPSLRTDAGYLITGGFGGIGLQVAKWAVHHGARHLVLMGRETLPPRAKWNEYENDSRIGGRIAAVSELEKIGATVWMLGCDIADEEQVFGALAEFEAESRLSIRGVIHSAGVARPQLLMQMEPEDFRSVLRPKVYGAWNLHRYFAGRELDFFVLYSSSAALIVSPGQANYTAGNTFLDALARYRQAQGLPGLSVNWGPWGEVGMATQLDLLKFFTNRGYYPLDPDKALEGFGHILQLDKPQVMVSVTDWGVVAQNNYPMGASPMMVADISAGIEGSTAEELVDDTGINALEKWKSLTYATEQMAFMESYLTDVIAYVLRMNKEKLSTDISLNELGLDSMLAIELRLRIEKEFDVNLPVVELLKGPTISDLSSILQHQLSGQQVIAG
ncbi:SDR family oxidoreductase [Paenibacillus sp. SI8]|uniref:SDR family oxidoreductase n=1 Tax=unclassified Paenibacillus TaxID=185978 RepID=UPI00346717A6